MRRYTTRGVLFSCAMSTLVQARFVTINVLDCFEVSFKCVEIRQGAFFLVVRWVLINGKGRRVRCILSEKRVVCDHLYYDENRRVVWFQVAIWASHVVVIAGFEHLVGQELVSLRAEVISVIRK